MNNTSVHHKHSLKSVFWLVKHWVSNLQSQWWIWSAGFTAGSTLWRLVCTVLRLFCVETTGLTAVPRKSKNSSTCAVLAVILVEFDEDRGRNHQEIPERGCGRVGNYWEPLTQATQTLKGRERQRGTMKHRHPANKWWFMTGSTSLRWCSCPLNQQNVQYSLTMSHLLDKAQEDRVSCIIFDSISAPTQQYYTCRQQMSRGMWAMITLLDVFDCSFSDSLVHKFSAPGNRQQDVCQQALQPEHIKAGR